MDTNNSVELNRWVDERLVSLHPSDVWQPNVSANLARLHELHYSGNGPARRWRWAGAAVAAVCLCAVALPSPRVFAHRCLECTVAVWQSLSAPGPVQADLKPENVRDSAPSFALKDANGDEVNLSSLKGRVVLVNFWATWCEGCQLEIPWFIQFQKEYQEQGLVVIGVSMDADGWKSVKPWLKEKKVNYSIVIGNQELGNRYGLDGMPLTTLIDRDGKIASSHSGLVNKTATEQRIRALLQEIPKSSAN